MELPHTKSVTEILDYYKVSETEGLSETRIEEQRKHFGYNGENQSHTILVFVVSLNVR